MTHRTLFPVPYGIGSLKKYATDISLTIDENYILSAYLVNSVGEQIGTEQTVDLPLESVIVDGRYDDNTQSLILVLDNGNEITIPVSGLIAGLQPTIDSNNPLNVDYTTDGTTNKVYTATEQSKLSGIENGAEVNVQSDWNQSDNTADDYIKNKPTIPAAQVNSDWNASSGVAEILNKPTIPAAQIQSDWNQSDNTQVDFIKNKPNIPAAQVNADWNAVSGVAEILNKPSMSTETLTFVDANNVSTTVVVYIQPQI